MKKNAYVALLGGLYCFSSNLAAWADLGKTTISSGAGDEIVVKHGLLGRKTLVHDRLGDKYESQQGPLGRKDTEVNILGNRVELHKNGLGFSEAHGQTILGDSFQYHKAPWGKDTNINLSGVNALFAKYFHQNPSVPMPSQEPNLALPPLPKQPTETLPLAHPGSGQTAVDY